MFVDEADYERYIALLARTVRHFGWILLAFCLMPNHVHLLVELREPKLAKGMHWLHSMYARYFNDRHVRSGRLFEHRYDAKLVADELYFATLVPYIEQNPVRALLCAEPHDWPWSSRGIIAREGCPRWLADDVLSERRNALRET